MAIELIKYLLFDFIFVLLKIDLVPVTGRLTDELQAQSVPEFNKLLVTWIRELDLLAFHELLDSISQFHLSLLDQLVHSCL